jgi:hypothetical protein
LASDQKVESLDLSLTGRTNHDTQNHVFRDADVTLVPAAEKYKMVTDSAHQRQGISTVGMKDAFENIDYLQRIQRT